MYRRKYYPHYTGLLYFNVMLMEWRRSEKYEKLFSGPATAVAGKNGKNTRIFAVTWSRANRQISKQTKISTPSHPANFCDSLLLKDWWCDNPSCTIKMQLIRIYGETVIHFLGLVSFWYISVTFVLIQCSSFLKDEVTDVMTMTISKKYSRCTWWKHMAPKHKSPFQFNVTRLLLLHSHI